MQDPNTDMAIGIMDDFLLRTGARNGREPRRYLWTDAFAVCNLLEIHRLTDDRQHLDAALDLVDQVHGVLGRHRPDDERRGWISGLSEGEGARHPTAGGLRIGKRMSEQKGNEHPDDDQEWDRDGQYFHYLTKWMHALARVAQASGEPRYLVWSAELALAAWKGFAYTSPRGRRMRWKMSIDLRRVVVPSMGQHDPLDGFVTFREVQRAATLFPEVRLPDLGPAIVGMEGICRAMGNLATSDPLGAGGLLIDAWQIAQMSEGPSSRSLEEVVEAAAVSVASSMRFENLRADRRLAFRELGLAIGLEAAGRLRSWALFQGPAHRGVAEWTEAMLPYLSAGKGIMEFWSDPSHRAVATWTDHEDINSVMLATALVPDGLITVPGTAILL